MAHDGAVTIEIKADTKSFDEEIKQTEEYLNKLVSSYEKAANMKGKLKPNEQAMANLRREIEKTNNKLIDLNEKQNKIDQGGIPKIKDIIESINNSMGKTIKKVGRWALAIFGIRSAYMAVRSAMATISENDEQLKADIDYIKDALAYTLEPVVRRIVDLIKQLMFYVAYLTKAWTGKNIFENANKSLKGANKQAKDLKKTMASFDEMNVLNDNTSSSGGGVSPSFDLTGLENMEEPKWLIMIKDIGQWIIDNWQEVIFGLLLTKLFIDLLTGNWIGVVIDLIGLLVIAFFKVKDAIITIYEDGKIVLGMFLGWIYDKFIKPLGDFFNALWNGIIIGFERLGNSLKTKFNSIVNFFKNIINTIVNLFKTIGTKVGDVLGGAFKAVINGVLRAIENILNAPIKSINKLLDVINKVPGIDLKTLPTFSLPRLAVGGIVNMPGRGVNYMGANIAEKGPEGIIPLTNSQMMSELGKAIGQYVTINANITNTMNGRVISSELQKVNSSIDFAFNR